MCSPVRSPRRAEPAGLEVLELVAAGLTNEAIAQRLVLSVRTVEHHLSSVYSKLGVTGSVARAAAAVAFVEERRSGTRPHPMSGRMGCVPAPMRTVAGRP